MMHILNILCLFKYINMWFYRTISCMYIYIFMTTKSAMTCNYVNTTSIYLTIYIKSQYFLKTKATYKAIY